MRSPMASNTARRAAISAVAQKLPIRRPGAILNETSLTANKTTGARTIEPDSSFAAAERSARLTTSIPQAEGRTRSIAATTVAPSIRPDAPSYETPPDSQDEIVSASTTLAIPVA